MCVRGEIDLARAGSMQKFAFVDRTVSAYEEMAGSRTPRRTGSMQVQFFCDEFHVAESSASLAKRNLPLVFGEIPFNRVTLLRCITTTIRKETRMFFTIEYNGVASRVRGKFNSSTCE